MCTISGHSTELIVRPVVKAMHFFADILILPRPKWKAALPREDLNVEDVEVERLWKLKRRGKT